MAVKLKHKITYVADAEIQGRLMNRSLKRSFTAAGNEVLGKYVPARFSPGAFRALGYKSRSQAYMRRKRRNFGHNNPFVYTGQMRQQALSTRRRTASAKRILVRWNVEGEKVRFLKKQGHNPQRLMSALTDKELKKVLQIIDERLGQELNSIREKRTKKV